MNQTHIQNFSNGRRLVCRVNISAIKHLAANGRIKDTKAALRCIEWDWGKEPATPDMLPEYRPFAMRMYGILAQTFGASMLIRGPSEVNGIDEAWMIKPDGSCEVQALPPPPPAPPELDMPEVDLDLLQSLGRLCQRDAQNMHRALCHRVGITEEKAIRAAWKERSPLVPWDCPPDECRGVYVEELTQLVVSYMKDWLSIAEAEPTGNPEPGAAKPPARKTRFFRPLKADEIIEKEDRLITERDGKRQPGKRVPRRYRNQPASAMPLRVCREMPRQD